LLGPKKAFSIKLGHKWKVFQLSALKKNIVWTAILASVGFFLSFASQIIISFYFGTSIELDAYWVALSLLNLFAFPLSPLKESLVPIVHRHSMHTLMSSSLHFSKGLSLILAVATVGVVALLFSGELVSGLILGVDSNEAIHLVTIQLYWLAPAIWLLAISETLNALLASFNKVIFQMTSRLMAAFATLFFIVILSAWIGIYSLPISFIFGQLVMCLVLAYAILKLGLAFKPSWPFGLGRDYFFLSLALLISTLSMQMYLLYEKYVFSSFGSGYIASFQYGVALTNVVIAILAISLANVFWPRFMKYREVADWDRLYNELTTAIKICLIVLGGLCSFIYVYANPIVEFIFFRGAFTRDALFTTSEMLRATIFTAIPIAVIAITGRALISLESAKSIVLVGLSVSISGFFVLMFSHFLHNLHLGIHHWLIANLVGCIASALMFAQIMKHKALH